MNSEIKVVNVNDAKDVETIQMPNDFQKNKFGVLKLQHKC